MLRSRDVAVLGSDTGNDVTPSGYERFSNPVHQVGIVGLGLWILDNAWLDGRGVPRAAAVGVPDDDPAAAHPERDGVTGQPSRRVLRRVLRRRVSG